ncbi:MAG: response regulator [Spirochaetaceae bacterium]
MLTNLDSTILIVDDIVENLDVLSGILGKKYNLKAATSGEMALKIIKLHKIDLILLDIMMPGLDGFEVCKKIKSDIDTKDIPVIFVSAKGEQADETMGFSLGAVDYITKPINASILLARTKTHLMLADKTEYLNHRVKERTKELETTRLELIKCLSRAGEFKDNDTGLHVYRMSKYSQLIALEYGSTDEEAELILHASPMHDVGKIGIADDILLKPGKLDKDEWKSMKLHPQYGSEIIGNHNSKIIKAAKLSSLTHHEKWDGTGYPNNLIGKKIPFIGRVVAIADVFDALTSQRPYKEAWKIDDAVDLINKESGKHFDPELVEAFNRVLPQIIDIKENFKETY